MLFPIQGLFHSFKPSGHYRCATRCGFTSTPWLSPRPAGRGGAEAASRGGRRLAVIRDGRFEISEIHGGNSRFQISDFRDTWRQFEIADFKFERGFPEFRILNSES